MWTLTIYVKWNYKIIWQFPLKQMGNPLLHTSSTTTSIYAVVMLTIPVLSVYICSSQYILPQKQWISVLLLSNAFQYSFVYVCVEEENLQAITWQDIRKDKMNWIYVDGSFQTLKWLRIFVSKFQINLYSKI